MDPVFYTIILAAVMCICLSRIHGTLAKIWDALSDMEERKQDKKS